MAISKNNVKLREDKCLGFTQTLASRFFDVQTARAHEEEDMLRQAAVG